MTYLDRRRFLAAAAAAVAASACSGGANGGKGGGPGGTGAPDDLATVARVAGLERLTVETYTGITTSFTEGRLGAALPPAVVALITTTGRQHQEHLEIWNRTLAAAGRPSVTAADLGLKPAVDAAAGRVIDVPGAATLALRLEDYLSQTYLKAIPTLTGADAVRTAAQILVVDQQHQAVLRYLLGLYPVGSGTVPDTKDFAPADPQPSLFTS